MSKKFYKKAYEVAENISNTEIDFFEVAGKDGLWEYNQTYKIKEQGGDSYALYYIDIDELEDQFICSASDYDTLYKIANALNKEVALSCLEDITNAELEMED